MRTCGRSYGSSGTSEGLDSHGERILVLKGDDDSDLQLPISLYSWLDLKQKLTLSCG